MNASSTVAKDLTPEARALLDTISSGEAHAYNIMNGGATFSGYGQHPQPYKGGRAAGRYQFLGSTWLGIQRETGLKDFSPESQDKGGWYLAQRDYRLRTGRNLQADLASKDPARLAEIGRKLAPTWVSLNGSFAGKYNSYFARDAAHPDASPVAAALASARSSAPKHGKPLPSWMSKGADGEPMRTTDYRDPAHAPLKVEVTKESAEAVGHAVGRRAFSAYAHGNRLIGPAIREHQEALQHLRNAQLVARAHAGRLFPFLHPHHHLSSAARAAISNSHSVSVVHNPTYKIEGGDPHVMLADAHRLSDRGTATLLRNLNVKQV